VKIASENIPAPRLTAERASTRARIPRRPRRRIDRSDATTPEAMDSCMELVLPEVSTTTADGFSPPLTLSPRRGIANGRMRPVDGTRDFA
jgi:hypothetical protein